MSTVRELLDAERARVMGLLAQINDFQTHFEATCSEVFDLHVGALSIRSPEECWLYLGGYTDNETPVRLLEILGLTQVLKDFKSRPGSSIMTFKTPMVTISLSKYLGRSTCKKYRVTQVVELCGEPDESLYESVEEVVP